MILIFIIYIILSLWLAIMYPKYFVIFYILITTKFLGFFDSEAFFVIQGFGLGFPSIHIMILMVVLIKGKPKKIAKEYRFFTFGFLSLLIYGIIRPYALGVESLFEALMASKEFWAISFLLYLVKFRKEIFLTDVINFVIKLGVYLSLVYILYILLNIGPPFYITDNGFRAYFPTYISLAWFFTYFLKITNRITTVNFLIYSIIFGIGLVLAGHSSITLTSIGLILTSIFIFKGRSTFSILTWIRIFVASLVMLFTVLVSESINNQINAIISGEDVALTSREKYNSFRWAAINDSPSLGYGFVHKNAAINEAYSDYTSNRFAERFEVVDSGYVDVLIKFGVLGLVFIILLWGSIIKLAFKRGNMYEPLKVVSGLYLLQYFFVNYTWSVFTYSHGLIPGFIAVLLIFSANKKINKNKFI